MQQCWGSQGNSGISRMKMTKQKYSVNQAMSTIKKKEFFSKKINTLAKKAAHYNQCGSYPFAFDGGAEIVEQ